MTSEMTTVCSFSNLKSSVFYVPTETLTLNEMFSERFWRCNSTIPNRPFDIWAYVDDHTGWLWTGAYWIKVVVDEKGCIPHR